MFLGRFKTILRSVLKHITGSNYRMRDIVFYRILVVFTVAITIPIVSIGLLSIKHSTDNILAHAAETSVNSLYDKKIIIEQRFSEVEKLAFQILFSQRYDDVAADEYIDFARVLRNERCNRLHRFYQKQQ